MAAILNFSKTLKITCTSPYGGECDSEIWIISDFSVLEFFSFRVFAPTKKLKWFMVAILNFSNSLKKSPPHLHVIVKFE